MSEKLLSYREADAVVREVGEQIRAQSKRVENVALAAALGRVLAEAVRADRDQPPFPRATRDGFAVRAQDLRGSLQVVGQIRAGELWQGNPLGDGDAIEIMTGAAVPASADAVVMIEHVERRGDAVTLLPERVASAGENIVPAGAEAKAGDVVLTAGVRIGAAQVAAAAACGYAELPVFARARVAILATGDELVEIADTPELQQIRNSNSYSLAAQVTAMEAEPVRQAIVPDRLDATERAIREALACDLVVMTGGVSMGKFDYVEQALSRLGAKFLFTGAKIQPGKPVVFGHVQHGDQKRYFFGLPGNPISTMVTFALFVSPLLAAFAGESGAGWPHWTRGELTEEVRVKPGLTRFLPARVEASVDGTRVSPIAWQGSGDLASAAQAGGFVVIPEDAANLAAGTAVSVLLIG